MHKQILILIKNLVLLNTEIFQSFLQEDYLANLYLYEKRLRDEKNNCLQWLDLSWKKATSIETKNLLIQYDLLYAVMLDYAQLRGRVTDHTVFSLCQNELKDIMKAMNDILEAVVPREGAVSRTDIETMDTSILSDKINYFEEIYQNVLRVTAPDPLVFILFINSLKKWSEEIIFFYRENSLGFCFSDETAPASKNYVSVIYGLHNKIRD